MRNYLQQFLTDTNHIAGDAFQIGCETFIVETDSVYGYWFTNCGNKVDPFLVLKILLGVQPITWISKRHFGPYDKY